MSANRNAKIFLVVASVAALCFVVWVYSLPRFSGESGFEDSVGTFEEVTR